MVNTTSERLLEASPSFVVIGYGDPQQGDDSIGKEVVSQLKALKIPNLEIYSVAQLIPELSGKLSVADFAIFVDACQMQNTDTVRVTSLDAAGSETTGSTIPALGHSCDPCSILALTQSVYGHYPKAWWIEVPASDFAVGHTRSELAEQGVAQALQVIKKLINSVTNPHSPG